MKRWKATPMKTRPESYRIIDTAQEGNGSISEIAHVYSLSNAEHNARLIAQSPRMAEELKNALILYYMIQDGQSIAPAELQNRIDAVSEILAEMKG